MIKSGTGQRFLLITVPDPIFQKEIFYNGYKVAWIFSKMSACDQRKVECLAWLQKQNKKYQKRFLSVNQPCVSAITNAIARTKESLMMIRACKFCSK